MVWASYFLSLLATFVWKWVSSTLKSAAAYGGKASAEQCVITHSGQAAAPHCIWAAWCFHISHAAPRSLMTWGCGPAWRLGFPVCYGLVLPTRLVTVPLHPLRARPAAQCGLAATQWLCSARLLSHNARAPFSNREHGQLVTCGLRRGTQNLDLRCRTKASVFWIGEGSFWRSLWRLGSGYVAIFFGTFMSSQWGPKR